MGLYKVRQKSKRSQIQRETQTLAAGAFKLTFLPREWVADLMEEMRIEEREQKVNCQAAGQLQPPFANQHLGGTSNGSQQQLASLASPYQQPGKSSDSRILHYLGSQDSLGQGSGGSQAETGRDGDQAALARREGIKKRSKSLKCNKVKNLIPLLH